MAQRVRALSALAAESIPGTHVGAHSHLEPTSAPQMCMQTEHCIHT